MTGRDVERFTRPELEFLAVVHSRGEPAGDDVAGVRLFAAVCTCDGLDILGPAPPGLEHCPPDRDVRQRHEIESPVAERTRLVGLVEALLLHPTHAVPPSELARMTLATGGPAVTCVSEPARRWERPVRRPKDERVRRPPDIAVLESPCVRHGSVPDTVDQAWRSELMS